MVLKEHEDSRRLSSSKRDFPSMLIESGQSGLTRLDYILAPLFAVICGVWLYLHIWTGRNWDDLVYMNLSQHTTQYVGYMNRYGHIYLQKLFIFLFGDVIRGVRVFWCFEICMSGLLLYWCARLLSGRKGLLVSILAVLFFVMQPIFAVESGSALADFTVMLIGLLMVFIYLRLVRERGGRSYLLIMLLGFLFYWAVKSKETGIATGIIFLGLGYDSDGKWGCGRFVRDIGWVFAGIAASIVFLIILDGIFMHDPLFSVNPSNYMKVMEKQAPAPTIATSRIIQSWFTYLSTTVLFVPLLLYLVSGVKDFVREYSVREKLTWLLPLVFLIVVSFVRKRFFIIPRYIVPAMPLICIWGAHYFRFGFSGEPVVIKGRRIPRVAAMIVLAVVAVILVLMLMPKVPGLIEYFKISVKSPGPHNLKHQRPAVELIFYMLVIMPIAVTILFIAMAFGRKRGLATWFFVVFAFCLTVFLPLSQNLKLLSNRNDRRNTAVRSRYRFLPYIAYKTDVNVDDISKVVVSRDIHARSWMLGRTKDNANWHMFNIFFNGKLGEDQVVEGGVEDILKGDYDYAFVTGRDMMEIVQKHKVDIRAKGYEIKQSDKASFRTMFGPIQVILLKKR
ncbi:MAG: ArnT family glycosyltransferase [Planctomycetota bacterium]